MLLLAFRSQREAMLKASIALPLAVGANLSAVLEVLRMFAAMRGEGPSGR